MRRHTNSACEEHWLRVHENWHVTANQNLQCILAPAGQLYERKEQISPPGVEPVLAERPSQRATLRDLTVFREDDVRPKNKMRWCDQRRYRVDAKMPVAS